MFCRLLFQRRGLGNQARLSPAWTVAACQHVSLGGLQQWERVGVGSSALLPKGEQEGWQPIPCHWDTTKVLSVGEKNGTGCWRQYCDGVHLCSPDFTNKALRTYGDAPLRGRAYVSSRRPSSGQERRNIPHSGNHLWTPRAGWDWQIPEPKRQPCLPPSSFWWRGEQDLPFSETCCAPGCCAESCEHCPTTPSSPVKMGSMILLGR